MREDVEGPVIRVKGMRVSKNESTNSS
jgi:hypothetical protein